jgi:DNA-binding transcriptional LysR family regulator
LRGLLDRAGEAAGFSPDVSYETNLLPRLRELVGYGLGVALVARSVAEAPGRPVTEAPGRPVTVHPVLPAPIDRPVGLLWPRDRPLTPAGRRCEQFLIG